jgi:hypothetical protein
MMAPSVESGLAAATLRYLDLRLRMATAARHQYNPNLQDALSVLRLSRQIVEQVAGDRGPTILDALRAGASWTQISGAMGFSAHHARVVLESWIAAQLRQHQAHEGRSGMSPAAAAAARRLADQAPGGEPR